MAPWGDRLSETEIRLSPVICKHFISLKQELANDQRTDCLWDLGAVVSYSLLYWLKPGWRQGIEQPKHIFQRQLDAYDRQQKTDESDP